MTLPARGSNGTLTHDRALEVVGMFGARLAKERTGWRDIKALLVIAAHESWAAAAALADALDVHPDDQEAIYRETQT